MKETVFLMLVTSGSSDAEKYLPEFSAPDSYRDTEKKIDFVNRKTDAFYEKAKFHAMTGQVTGAFIKCGDEQVFLTTDKSPEGDSIETAQVFQDETSLILEVFVRISKRTLVGANVRKFHAPFLVRRAIFLGIPIPHLLLPDRRGYYDDDIIDLLSVWSLGNREEEYTSLKDILTFAGVEPSKISTMISDLELFQKLPLFAQWSEGISAVRQLEIAYNKLSPLL